MNIPGLTDMLRPAVAGATGQETGIKAGVAAIAEPFDAAKVERIKAAIRNGEFQTNSAAVAHKLLASVHELFRPAH